LAVKEISFNISCVTNDLEIRFTLSIKSTCPLLSSPSGGDHSTRGIKKPRANALGLNKPLNASLPEIHYPEKIGLEVICMHSKELLTDD
jgi:hypothetical protein